jgi:hypothetical protein
MTKIQPRWYPRELHRFLRSPGASPAQGKVFAACLRMVLHRISGELLKPTQLREEDASFCKMGCAERHLAFQSIPQNRYYSHCDSRAFRAPRGRSRIVEIGARNCVCQVEFHKLSRLNQAQLHIGAMARS